jgi:hypothetical protein
MPLDIQARSSKVKFLTSPAPAFSRGRSVDFRHVHFFAGTGACAVERSRGSQLSTSRNAATSIALISPFLRQFFREPCAEKRAVLFQSLASPFQNVRSHTAIRHWVNHLGDEALVTYFNILFTLGAAEYTRTYVHFV